MLDAGILPTLLPSSPPPLLTPFSHSLLLPSCPFFQFRLPLGHQLHIHHSFFYNSTSNSYGRNKSSISTTSNLFFFPLSSSPSSFLLSTLRLLSPSSSLVSAPQAPMFHRPSPTFRLDSIGEYLEAVEQPGPSLFVIFGLILCRRLHIDCPSPPPSPSSATCLWPVLPMPSSISFSFSSSNQSKIFPPLRPAAGAISAVAAPAAPAIPGGIRVGKSKEAAKPSHLSGISARSFCRQVTFLCPFLLLFLSLVPEWTCGSKCLYQHQSPYQQRLLLLRLTLTGDEAEKVKRRPNLLLHLLFLHLPSSFQVLLQSSAFSSSH